MAQQRLFKDNGSRTSASSIQNTVGKNTVHHGHEWLIQTGLIVLCVPYYLLAGMVVWLNGKTVDDVIWDTIQRILSATVTVFPIFFAVILGRTIQQFCSWKLEQGISLGSLEQLMGSSTIGKTLTTLASMRSFRLGIPLLSLWALSPIGGQSSLHVINTKLVPASSAVTLQYFSTEQDTAYTDDELTPASNIVYTSSLVSPPSLRYSSRDLWGNVKVPDMSLLTTITSDNNNWKNLSPTNNVTYSSLIGIPISHLPDHGNTSFTIETSYFSVDCQNITVGPLVNYTVLPADPSTAAGSSSLRRFYSGNGSMAFSLAIDKLNVSNGILDYGNPYRNAAEEREMLLSLGATSSDPQSVLFQSVHHGGFMAEGYNIAQCALSTSYVESSILCTGSTCAAVAVRPSRNASLPDTFITALMYHGTFAGFSSKFQEAAGSFSSVLFQSATEYYLYDPDFATNRSTGAFSQNAVDISAVNKQDFGKRLQQLLNTYWHASMDPMRIMGSPNIDNAGGSFNNVPETKTTNGTYVVFKNTYVCQFPWLFGFVIGTTAFTIAALIGARLMTLTQGPDILGYCSSLTRDSLYIALDSGGSALGGVARAKKFASTKLKLVDVGNANDNSKEGYITIVNENTTRKYSHLRRDGRYK